MARWTNPALVVCCLLASAPEAAWAQAGTPTIDQGTNPYSSYHGGDIDSVSLANGSLILHIPLISYPQRGKLNLGFYIAYDNHTYNSESIPEGDGRSLTVWFYKGIGVHIMADLPWVNALPVQVSNSYVYEAMTSDGASHPTTSTSDGLLSMDATGFHYNTTTGILIDRDGIRYTDTSPGGFGPPSEVEDPNGNLITLSGANFTDSVGRVIPLPPMWNNNSGTTSTSLTGCPSTSTVALLWAPPGVNGGTVPFTICGQGATTELLIQSIILPNGTAWTFQYNGPNLTQITLPTGGTIQYEWVVGQATSGGLCTGVPVTCPVAVNNRSVVDSTGTHTWTYSGDTGQVADPSFVVTVTDPNQNQTVHTFTSIGAPKSVYETLTQTYQNINGMQTLLKTVATAYSGSEGSFGGNAVGINVVPTSVSTTWPNNQVSQIQKTYDTGISGHILGQVLEEQDYDYGNGSPGPLLRQVNTTYLAPGNSAYLANNLFALPSTVTTYNGAGTQTALTTYGYDGAALKSSGLRPNMLLRPMALIQAI